MQKALVVINTNDFYTSRVGFRAVVLEKDLNSAIKGINETLGLFHSSSSGNLMGDYRIYGRNNFSISTFNIGNTDLKHETVEEVNNRLKLLRTKQR
jgi:hypothetical protein